MPTATREIFKDDQPLFSGTHKGADSSNFLWDEGAMFRQLGVNQDLTLYIENETQGTSGNIYLVENDKIWVATAAMIASSSTLGESCTGDGGCGAGESCQNWRCAPISPPITWDYGDTYNIYATDTKNAFIADQWCDVSRGWRINPRDDVDDRGWRREDIDIDGHDRKKVFGPGQPE